MPTLDVAALIDLLDEAARIAAAATEAGEPVEREQADEIDEERPARRAAAG
jgi:hypothetical protein